MTADSAENAQSAPFVAHVSPTYFAPESFVGGGERYAEELSRAMADLVPVRFISFGPRAFRQRVGARYERVILRSWTRDKMTPFSPRLWTELGGASVVHCYQLNTLSTFLAALFARLRGVPAFVTDLGGGGWTPGYHIDPGRWIDGHLPISAYASRLLPSGAQAAQVIYGGVDLQKYPPRPAPRHDGTVVFLGRILPHKGIHALIEGLPRDRRLKIVGPAGDASYLERLRRLAAGKQVTFVHDASDADVGSLLREAAVLVHPTPTDADGTAGVRELLGLSVLEAMASGCVVVVSDAASLPELIEDGRSGLLVPPNDPGAIHRSIQSVLSDLSLWQRLSSGARLRIEERFLWCSAVTRCLDAYAARGAGISA